MKKSILSQALAKSLRSKYIAQGGALRFKSFQKWLLEADLPAEHAAMLCLFAFDGLRIIDFRYVIKSKPTTYEEGKVGIAWQTENGRTQRIRLSSITMKLISQCSWESVQKTSIDLLADAYQAFSGNKAPLNHFQHDQLVWFSEIASGPVVEHFSDRIPMTALPDQAYARLMSKQALIVEKAENAEFSVDENFAVALSGYLEPRGEDKNPVAVDKLIHVCSRKKTHRPKHEKQSMLHDCQELAIFAADYGPISALLTSWAIDLISNGTSNKENLSVSTIVNYIGAVSRPVFNALKQQKINEWESVHFQLAYEKLIQNSTPGQQRNLASGLNSWHRFLVDWLDFPPIAKQLHNQVPIVPPHSNVLWPHEHQEIIQWLSTATMDERLVLYLETAFCIATQVRVRINELFHLKLEDFKVYENSIEICIHGTKTQAATRSVGIPRINAQQIELCLIRREGDLANKDHFLFGDPNTINSIYRLSNFYTKLNQLLKGVSGDRSVRSQTLSHTVISRELSEILIGGTNRNVNPLNQLATNFAHFSILTSINSYTHIYEDAVRHSLNRGIKQIKITSKIAEKWSNDKSSAILQRIYRKELNANDHYWQTILNSEDSTNFYSLTDLYKTEEAEYPKFLSVESKDDFQKILHLFSDVASAITLEAIALRQSISLSRIREYLKVAKALILDGTLCPLINYQSSEEEVMSAIAKIAGLNFKKINQNKIQAIHQWFSRFQPNIEISNRLHSWLNAIKGGYIVLSPDSNTRHLVSLFSNIGVPLTHLGIAHDASIEQQDLRLIQSIFVEQFGATVPHFEVELLALA